MVFWIWHLIAFGDEAPVLELWVIWSHLFVAITPRSTLTQTGSNGSGLMYIFNRSVWKLSVLDKNTKNHINVGKQMIINK